jgi:hypothetical protein
MVATTRAREGRRGRTGGRGGGLNVRDGPLQPRAHHEPRLAIPSLSRLPR